MAKQVYFVKHVSSHHASHSGYTRLLEFINGTVLTDDNSGIPYKIRKGITNYISNEKGIYNSSSLAKDITLIKKIISNPDGIVHYLNGERDIRFSTYLAGARKWKLTASFHEPPDVIINEIKDFKYLRKLDGAIAVGINQMQLLSEKIGGRVIQYIPHGVDTSFFTPSGNQEWDYHTAIFVGQHLRDFTVLKDVIQKIKMHIPDFKLKVIIREDFHKFIPKLDWIEMYSSISDEMLRLHYQKAAFLLLPLKEVTACNAILEAMACGIPILTTDLEGNRGYVNDSCSILIKDNSVDDFVQASLMLMEDTSRNNSMRQMARIHSLNFSWELIAKELNKHYNLLYV